MIHAYAAQKAGGKLKPFEYDPGELKPVEVEIEVDYCGICHSDLSMLDNEWGMTTYPFVPGHEVVGRIAQIGNHVQALKVGDRVGLGWHAAYCNHCPACRSGDNNLCSNSTGTIVGHHGGFADKVRAEENCVFKLPEGIDLESTGPLFCGGITVFNPLVQLNVKPTDKVAVIGIGGLGHLAVQFMNAWGCEVTAFTSHESKKPEALKLGAHHALNSRNEEEIAAVAGTFDMILSTVNVKLDWNLYLQTLKPKGHLHFVGATLEPLDISVFSLIGSQHSISGSPAGSPTTIEAMLKFAVHHEVRPIIEKFKFAEVNEAMDHLRNGKAKYRIVLEH